MISRTFASLSESSQASGCLWVVSPRGTSAVTERNVMDSARAAGLVDVKVVRFSDTYTSAKLVIPVALREARREPGSRHQAVRLDGRNGAHAALPRH